MVTHKIGGSEIKKSSISRRKSSKGRLKGIRGLRSSTSTLTNPSCFSTRNLDTHGRMRSFILLINTHGRNEIIYITFLDQTHRDDCTTFVQIVLVLIKLGGNVGTNWNSDHHLSSN